MLTKRQRNSKLYKFLERVLGEVALDQREGILSSAQLQEEFHALTGRWVEPWQIDEMAREIMPDFPVLDYTVI
jgi:hypothetical protein